MATQTSIDQQQQKKALNFFNNGFAAFERGNLDMAIELLNQSFEIDPMSFRTRKFLRAATLQRYMKSKPSALKLKLAELGAIGSIMKTEGALKSGKIRDALIASEKTIEAAPLSLKGMTLAAKSALAAGQADVAAMIFETALQVDLGNEDVMSGLADIYVEAKEWKKAREIYAALVAKHPQDGRLVTLLKDTEARMTMAGGWEEVVSSDRKEGFRELIKNKEEASKLDMKNKANVAEGDDAEAMIADQREKIRKDPRNINYYRGLARIFQQLKRYDEAVETLQAARQINSADPELDRMLTNVSILAYDSKIEALIQEGKSEEADELRTTRNQFVFDDLVQRVERYPNDLRLRFELGQQYLMYDAYDDAIQQFQLSQRSPKERILSLHGLAKCFRAKGQRDMAVMQLETALEQLHVMDDTKKAVLFDLGEMAEEAGDIEKAFKIYREIYGADIAYKDIGEKMERIYKLRQQKSAQ